VSTARKLVLLASAWTQARFVYLPEHPAPALPAIEPLVQACLQETRRAEAAKAFFPNRAMPQRVSWMLELFERREHERLQRRARAH